MSEATASMHAARMLKAVIDYYGNSLPEHLRQFLDKRLADIRALEIPGEDANLHNEAIRHRNEKAAVEAITRQRPYWIAE